MVEPSITQTPDGKIPALAYRQSRKPWAIVVPLGWLTGMDFDPKATATIDLDSFCELIKMRMSVFNSIQNKALK
jgi:hypothetical protein